MEDFDTTAVHGGKRRSGVGPVATPIHVSSTFDYPELADGSPSPYIYTRYANPTIEAAEARIAALEGTPGAVVFSSGMAAIAGALLAVVGSGDTVVSSPILYGGTRRLFDEAFARLGIRVRYLDPAVVAAPARLAAALGKDDKVLYLESPTNPMLRVLDVPQLAAAAHAAKIPVVLDNTFAGPVLARPAAWGVDLVVESATKSMGGHSDLIAGAVAGGGPLLEKVRDHRRIWGSCIDPEAAYRLERGLATLPLRVRRAGETARALAEALEGEPWVLAVHHPSLARHPDHAVAAATLAGPVALVTLVMKGGDAAAVRLRRAVKLVRPAASLGGVESLLSLPFETSHAHLDAAARTAMGVPPGAVRLSVGLESADGILADLRAAASTRDPKGQPL